MVFNDATLLYMEIRGTSVSMGFEENNIFEFELTKPFKFEFDELHYEPVLDNSYKIVKSYKIKLVSAEIMEIKLFINNFINTEIDYMVYTYEPLKDNSFTGAMFKREAEKQRKKYVTYEPENTASKLVNNKWERVVAVIRDDGSYELYPMSLCDRCVLIFSETEWEKHPKPPVNEGLDIIYKWNFVTEKWEDILSISELIAIVKEDVTNLSFSYSNSMKLVVCGHKFNTTMFNMVRIDIDKYIDEYKAISGNDIDDNFKTLFLDKYSEYIKLVAACNSALTEIINIVDKFTDTVELHKYDYAAALEKQILEYVEL